MASKERRTFDGIVFDSRSEMLRWLDLQLLERAGEISKLRRQVVYPLAVNGEAVCSYEADFVYEENGVEITEDVKGLATPAFRIKAKLMKAVWGIDIRITGRKPRAKRTAKIRAPVGKHRPGVLSVKLRK